MVVHAGSQLIEELSPGLGRTLSFQVLGTCILTCQIIILYDTHTEGQGEPEFAFLQFSIVNRERFLTIPFITNETDYIQTSELFVSLIVDVIMQFCHQPFTLH